MIDFSPVLISLKTGIITIVITFVLGLLAARWIIHLKNEVIKTVADALFT